MMQSVRIEHVFGATAVYPDEGYVQPAVRWLVPDGTALAQELADQLVALERSMALREGVIRQQRCVCLDYPGRDGRGRPCGTCDGSGWNPV